MMSLIKACAWLLAGLALCANGQEADFPDYSLSIDQYDKITLKVKGKTLLEGGGAWLGGGGCRFNRNDIEEKAIPNGKEFSSSGLLQNPKVAFDYARTVACDKKRISIDMSLTAKKVSELDEWLIFGFNIAPLNDDNSPNIAGKLMKLSNGDEIVLSRTAKSAKRQFDSPYWIKIINYEGCDVTIRFTRCKSGDVYDWTAPESMTDDRIPARLFKISAKPEGTPAQKVEEVLRAACEITVEKTEAARGPASGKDAKIAK